MSVILSASWSPHNSGRIDRHRGAGWSSSLTRRHLVQCWKTADLYHTTLQCFSSATLYPTTAKLNPMTGAQMSTSECRNYSRYLLPFSLVYLPSSGWGNFWVQCCIQIIIFKTHQWTYHPWGHIILFRLPLRFCIYHVLHQWVPQFSFVVFEENSFLHSALYLAIIFIGGCLCLCDVRNNDCIHTFHLLYALHPFQILSAI